MKNKVKVTIAVTGLNNIDSPGPGIPVIRALRDSDFFDSRIIGLSYEALEPGLYMRELVDKSYSVPLPTAGSGALLERLGYINHKEKIDVIIPNFDAELHGFIKIAETLNNQLGIKTFLPSAHNFESRHKTALEKFGKANKVKVPVSKMVSSVGEIYKLEKELSFPLVVKGKYYDAYIATTPTQAVSYFHRMAAKWGSPVILQEFVSGTEVNVTAIGDGKGTCIGAVPMRKLYITDKGKAWAGVSLDDPELIEITNRVISNSKWKGGCELEFIRTKDDDYYLLEMNPRFPAWVYLSVGCGQNHPEALVKMALGYEVEPFETYEKGVMFVRYSYDKIVRIGDFEKISTSGEL